MGSDAAATATEAWAVVGAPPLPPPLLLLLADGVTAIKLEARLELRVLRIDCSSYMRCTLDRPRGVRPVGAADGLDDEFCAVGTRDEVWPVREGGRSGR